MLSKPKISRTWRSANLAKELKHNGIKYQWFNKNTILIEIPVKVPERRRNVLITGSLTCYKVRIDHWSYITGGSFTYHEIEAVTGNNLLWELVSMDLLPKSYLPITKHISKVEAHGGLNFDQL